MPYKDVTYDNGFTERYYYDETPYEEALRMSRSNSVLKFPSVNEKSAARNSSKGEFNSKDDISPTKRVITECT